MFVVEKCRVKFTHSFQAKRQFFKNTIESKEIYMISNKTDTRVLNTVWKAAQSSIPRNNLQMMKKKLVESHQLTDLTEETSESLFSEIYRIGKDVLSSEYSWRSIFIQSVVSSHLIPCFDESTSEDVLNILCDIVENSITPEVAAKKTLATVLASSVDLPMFSENTEKVVFESLYDIAASILMQ